MTGGPLFLHKINLSDDSTFPARTGCRLFVERTLLDEILPMGCLRDLHAIVENPLRVKSEGGVIRVAARLVTAIVDHRFDHRFDHVVDQNRGVHASSCPPAILFQDEKLKPAPLLSPGRSPDQKRGHWESADQNSQRCFASNSLRHGHRESECDHRELRRFFERCMRRLQQV